jgi:5-methyltetrahydropteroyltriglutamate--homocysteine methyltransferase
MVPRAADRGSEPAAQSGEAERPHHNPPIGGSMKRSTDRILTTHVGSLARPVDLLDLMKAKENDEPYDKEAFDKAVTDAVADRVAHQVECGLDVITDGEMSKVSFLGYVKDRLGGFEIDDGPTRMAPSWQAEVDEYPDYYADYFQKYSSAVAPLRRLVCKGPITYTGQELLQTDIDNLKSAAEGKQYEEIFMPSTGPSGFGLNDYFDSYDEYLHQVAEAMRDEYLAIVDAGLILQVDDPWLTDLLSNPKKDEKQRRHDASVHVEALNNALRGIPEEKIRHHTCFGLNHGPRTHDIALPVALEYTLQINAGAYSFEVMNPRHMHEWRVWEDLELPEGRILIPGLLGHANNYVEHPELIAEYICHYADLVGRENVIAGADCGFSSRASYHPEVHPTVVWPKFKALVEGARIATERLWGKSKAA